MTTSPTGVVEVPAAEANRNFSRLLRQVRDGQTVLVTSHGRPVATLAPVGAVASDADARAEPSRKAALLAQLDRLREQSALNLPRISRQEIWDEMLTREDRG